MNATEEQARERAAAEPRYPFSLSVAEARALQDWGLSEEAVAGWMDWFDEWLRERLAVFVTVFSPQEPEGQK
jgi:hypothetical protein